MANKLAHIYNLSRHRDSKSGQSVGHGATGSFIKVGVEAHGKAEQAIPGWLLVISGLGIP